LVGEMRSRTELRSVLSQNCHAPWSHADITRKTLKNPEGFTRRQWLSTYAKHLGALSIKSNWLGTKESTSVPPDLAQATSKVSASMEDRSVNENRESVEISVGRGILFYFYIIIFGFFNSDFYYYFYSFQSFWAPVEGVGMTG
jgi:hypothetical protein